jgi:hypothetical protein
MPSIYKAWMMNYRPAWYALGKTGQDELMGKITDSLAKAGGKELLIAASLWADEKWAGWGIEEFQDVEGAIQHARTIANEHFWYRYVQSWSILGFMPDPEAKVVVPKAPIYKLALVNPTEASYALSKAEEAKWDTTHAEFAKQVGAQVIMGCFSAWCNEAWLYWLVEAYPSLEAVQTLRMKTYEAGWYQYVAATSLLGTEYQV